MSPVTIIAAASGAVSLFLLALTVQALIAVAYPESFSLGEIPRRVSPHLVWIFPLVGTVLGPIAARKLNQER